MSGQEALVGVPGFRARESNKPRSVSQDGGGGALGEDGQGRSRQAHGGLTDKLGTSRRSVTAEGGAHRAQKPPGCPVQESQQIDPLS